jgi:hypothetical protein
MKPATIEMNVRTTGSARPTGEEPLRAVDVGIRDQQVPAEPADQRPLADPAHRVGHERADELGHRPDDDHGDDVEMPLTSQHPGEAECDLRGNRYAARLKEPEQEDCGEAELAEKALHSSLLYRIPAVP